MKGQEELSEEDGYFTCAVSVQHKKHDFETSSAYSASDSEHARKVVWPANQTKVEKQTVDTSRTFQNTFKQSTAQTDHQHKWLQTSENEDVEKKTAFEMRQSSHRISRSNSRSKNIMDRARSFERAAADSRGNSRPASRTGSIASRHRSPSGTRGQVDEMWMNQLERPGSRTDVDSRRFGEIGKVLTSDWEERIKGSTENLPTRTPPLKRRELNMKRNPDLERGLDTKTPEPPPPPTRMTYPPNTIKEPECEFPPPPESDTKSKLSEESVSQISEENKENIVKQWVESTTQSAEEIAKELEKFAYDIAETVVSNMEKNSEKKESYGTHSHQAIATASSHEQMPNALYADFWEKQTSIAAHKEFVAFSNNKNNKATNNISRETQKTQASGGMYFAAPATTSHRELHGPVYVQEENRRVGMTFQQEERRREELRKQEEAKQEEKRRCEIELEAQQLQEEQQRKLVEMRQAQEEETRRQEEARRLEMERQQKLLLQKQEEDRKRQSEIEEKTRQEEFKRAEEQRLKQQELKKIEEEKKRQEILRFEKLKQEEELKRQEEARLEQEMRRQFEMQQQLDIQRKKEQQLLLEQQQLEIQRQQEQQQLLMQQQQLEIQHQREEQQQMEIQCQREEQKRMDIERQRDQQLLLEQQKIQQESISVRDHIPKIAKTKSFEASQDRQEVKHEDHLSLIKTGQVNEKRNFWIRSTSADRLNQVSLSPAPRRRRIDWNANKQKENDDPESRPGSSLGQANTGSVRNLSSGFIAKSKSSAAVMQDELERGRPKQKSVIANGWTKEQYDQKIKQDFLKSQEVKTNKVTDTVQTWGKRDSSQTGRTTPAPSRNIGEGFSENRVGKTSEVDKNANSWRTKTPEPTLKLVNVSVEKAIGSTQNIHISENAHKQMASFMTSSTVQQKEEVMNTVMTNTMSSQSSVTSHSMSTTSRCSADINTQPPPTPERNQSYGVAVRYLNQ